MAQGRIPASKKNARRRGATLVFLDESGFMLTPTVRRTFAPRGQTPIHRCWDRRDRISAISAITVSPRQQRVGLYFFLLPTNENVHGEEVVEFLRLIDRHLRTPLTVIWDRGNVHDRSKVVRTYLAKHPRILTAKLPGYAPDLNPDEGVWAYTKFARMANLAPADSEDLRRTISAELSQLRTRKDLLRSFIEHAKLEV